MADVHQVIRAAYVAARQASTTIDPTTTASLTASPSASSSMSSSTTSGNGPTNSPLLFFVALGFGVVFTNLWIIVGVKYCFRYNARNRAMRNGEDVDPINLENMPTRPHRRRREKKLMTMDEVNERFPLTKYKNWVASRAGEGLPITGGVTAPPSRAGSLRNVDRVMPSSPTTTKHSVISRPNTAGSEPAPEITVSGATNNMGGEFYVTAKEEKEEKEENQLETIHTTASTVDKHATVASEEEDDEDDHIHTAVPPELLTNPGDSCAICIDTLEDDDDIRGLTCGHAFHAGCLDPWLTSRRACCPLCKADYYTPKPRPEGEAPAENVRSGRRRNRDNLPQPPPSAWTGIRGNPRLILPGRFGTGALYGDSHHRGFANRSNRAPEVTAPGAGVTVQDVTTAPEGDIPAPRRWAPRIGNPFNSMSMPRLGRNRQTDSSDPSPSQLEANVVR